MVDDRILAVREEIRRGKYEKGKEVIIQLESDSKITADEMDLFFLLLEKFHLYRLQGNFDSCETVIREISSLSTLDSSKTWQDLLRGQLLASRGDFAAAKILAEKTMNEFEEKPQFTEFLLESIKLFCYASRMVGSTSNSMELIEKGKKLATQKDQSYQLAQLLLEQSAFEIKEGKYDHCLKTVESMINICRIKEYKPTLVKAFSHLSFVKFDRGDYDGAFNGYENCLQLSRELKDSFGIAENLHNLAVVAKQQGKFDAALDYFNQSLEVVQQLGERFREASTIYNIGLLYGQQGNYELAETFLKKAEKLAKQQDNLLFELMTRSGLARVAIAKNDLTSANNYFEEVVTGFKSLGIADRRYADALIGLAVVQVDQNNPSIERTLAELKDLESSQNSSYINIAHGFLTGYYRLGCNENEEASKEFKNALRLAEESKLYEYQVNALVNLAMIEFSRYQKIPDISYRAEMEKYMNRVCELFGNQKDLFCQVKTKIIKALIRFLDFDYEIALHELQELKTLVSENMMVREQAEVETYLEKLQELSNTYLELSQEGKKEMEKEMELDRLKSKLEIDLDTYLKELQTRTMELLH